MKEDIACIVILITTPTGEEAHKIATELLNRRKAACVNIIPGVSSLFRWQDALDSASEHLLIVKSKASLLDEIVTLVTQIHSYDVPEIIALPIAGGNPAYIEWIGTAVA